MIISNNPSLMFDLGLITAPLPYSDAFANAIKNASVFIFYRQSQYYIFEVYMKSHSLKLILYMN